MTTATTTATILALDLGKYKSVPERDSNLGQTG